MVQAESVAATLVYTYNANGLRVAQSVIGFGEPAGGVTTFVWDWANPTMSGGISEMFSDGGQAMGSPIALYLVRTEPHLGVLPTSNPGLIFPPR